MKNRIKIIMVIIGTLIGAGFASGREIYLFFVKYGARGIIGIAISSILASTIIYNTLKKIKENEISNYPKLLAIINNKHPKVNLFISWVVNTFLLISFYIMIAGFSAYCNQNYNIEKIFSSIIFVLICYCVFNKSVKGILKINEILVPFLIIFIFYLGIKNAPYLLETKAKIDIETIKEGWLIQSILYISYNSIILIPVLTTLKKYIKTKDDIKFISIISGILIFVLASIIYGLLLRGQWYIKELDLPLFVVVLQFGKIFQYLYSFVIVISIFTSAISIGYSFLENINKTKKNYFIALNFMCISGIFIAPIGFSKLLEILYPFFGFLGLIQIIFLLTNSIKSLEKNRKN